MLVWLVGDGDNWQAAPGPPPNGGVLAGELAS
jgi:hypothetical protein